MERILKRRRPLSPLEMQQKYGHLVGKAIRPIALNNYLILSRQLVINRLAGGQDWPFDRRSAKMLVVRECGQQHIITFTLPSSDCTVQDLLRQIDVQFDDTTTIDALENDGGSSIRVVVSVGFRMKVTAGEMVAHAEQMYREMVQREKEQPPPAPPPTNPPPAPADNNGYRLADAPAASKSKKRKRDHNGCSSKSKKHKQRRSTSGKSSKEPQGAVRNGKESPGRAAETLKSKKHKMRRSTEDKPAAPKEKLKENTPIEAKKPRQDDKPTVSAANKVSETKPKTSSVLLAPTTTWSAAMASKTPEERAELSRLRRNRRWILSRDCDSDDDDDEPVVLLSSSSEDEQAEAEQGGEASEPERRLSAEENLTLLMYPPTGTGGLSIGMKDYMCLSRGTYLNDIIIDFYLRWLKDNVIPEGQRERTHIFSTFFHKRLTTLTRPINIKQTAAQKRHERVQKWTRSVDIFDKDFIIVPFNEQAHWLLAIICFPSLRGPVVASGEGGDDGPIKQPVILIFDSLAVTSRHRAIAILRDYLTCEYRAKNPDGQAHVFNKDNMPGIRVEVPQQENLTDCGLYLLQYVEHFFTQPIRDYRLPIADLNNWFDLLTVTKKREDIANLIQKLMDEGNQQQQRKVLPVIEFPTLNGQLVEDEEEKEMED